MLVHPAPVAAEPLADMLGGDLEGAVGVDALALPPHEQVAAGLQVDVAGEEAGMLALGVAAEGHVGFQRVIEILVGDGGQALADMGL